ncbi:ABSCISIC ACID-INSENSITIVE 5-like protein 3 [Rutidosis leptorrhynchoides]|uniref:ABSCISIC ACID-INSENSITIVE 5-like protein 3 n=1 Tax=Rutidosis leptorrhynchoides TaxID=125765 RepID=UPI003A992475
MASHSASVQEHDEMMLFGRHGSWYNLTLDEVQNQLRNLGKPLGSMNLEELVHSVLNAEASEIRPGNSGNNNIGQPYNLGEDGSLLGLPSELSEKTVEEVWRHIQEKNTNPELVGKMTLEDFLKKAGVVATNNPPQIDHGHHGSWMQYDQHEQMMLAAGRISEPLGILDGESTQAPKCRKRVASGGGGGDVLVQKTVERKKRRMIKNRESAARSRARRQAYTHELENKVSWLEEENERLKRQKGFEVLATAPPPIQKYQLRRTTSAPL